MDIEEFRARLDNVRGRSARCPAHHDSVNSLSFDVGEHGSILLYCHAGCSTESVVASLGLTMADLAGLPVKVAEYHYTDLAGQILYTVERWSPKAFRGYLPPPSGRVLYNQLCIGWARANGLPVYWPEGEKDVDNFSARGIPSVTGCGGAGPGKILPQYVEALRGVDVIVVADNDAVGREFAREKARLLDGVARSVQLVHSCVGSDVSDAFDAGYGLDMLEPLQTTDDVGSYLAAHVQPRKLRWAWKGFFALGKIGLIEGDPGDGKSIMTVDLAARWSNGMKMPDGSNGMPASPVLLISAEDDLEDTLIPRIIAAGGDRSKIHLMVHGATPDAPFTFREDLPSVYRAIVRHGIKVVIFDPLMAFLGGETDSHNDASVRRALQPLKLMAANTGVACLLVRHLNKGTGGPTKAVYRGGGSIAFTGAARSTFVVTVQDDGVTKVMSCVKNNLARKPDSLTYTVEVGPEDVPYVRWGQSIDLTAQEALDGPGRRQQSEASDELRSKKKVRILAGEFLLEFVEDGPKAWKEIVEAGKQEGHSAMTLVRARAEVGLTRITSDGGMAGTRWASPEVPPTPPLNHFLTDGGLKPKPAMREQVTKSERDEPAIGTETSDMADDETRDMKLAQAELVCDVCATTINVNRYGKPFWLIRCLAHDPRYYGGENGTEET